MSIHNVYNRKKIPSRLFVTSSFFCELAIKTFLDTHFLWDKPLQSNMNFRKKEIKIFMVLNKNDKIGRIIDLRVD